MFVSALFFANSTKFWNKCIITDISLFFSVTYTIDKISCNILNIKDIVLSQATTKMGEQTRVRAKMKILLIPKI